MTRTLLLGAVLAIGTQAESTARGRPAPGRGVRSQGATMVPAQSPSVVLLETIWESPTVEPVTAALGIQPMPLVAEWRFFNQSLGRFDRVKYMENIWRPDLLYGVPGEYGDETRFGIPEGYDGWVLLDFEPPVLADHVESYVTLIAETRALRPDAQLCAYLIAQPFGDFWYHQAVATILPHVDAIAPQIFLTHHTSGQSVIEQENNLEAVMQYCLDLGQQYGVKVLPMVWKRYGAGTDELGRKIQLLLPAAYFGDTVEIALADYDGVRADGVILFGADNLVYFNPEGTRVHPDTTDQETIDTSEITALEIVSALAAGPDG